PETLPPLSRTLTFAERVRDLSSRSLQDARRAREARQQECRQVHQAEPVWNLLHELADHLVALQTQIDALTQRHPRVGGEVEREATAVENGEVAANPFNAGLAECIRLCQETQTRIDKILADHRGQIDQLNQEEGKLLAEIEPLQPLAAAWQYRRWWTVAWW